MITATHAAPESSAEALGDRPTRIATMLAAAAGVVVSLVLMLDVNTTVGVATVVTPASVPDTPCPGAPPHAAC